MKASEIAEFVKGELRGTEDPEIDAVSDFGSAGPGTITFLEKPTDSSTNASCVITSSETDTSEFIASIVVETPKLAFSRIAAIIHKPKPRDVEIHDTAVIAENAQLGEQLFIGAYVCVGEASTIGDGTQIRAGAKIGDNVSIGRECVIHPNVFIGDGSTVGNNVILHSGVVVGADGFGYVNDDDGTHVKFPQIGSVVIEDNVEIGANTCIDRGSLGETRIGAGTKIDNLVQIAHNVQIGKRCIIASLSGIAGSSTLEDDVVLGGQVGIADHVTLRQGVVIGSKSAVFPNKIISGGIWSGIPVEPLDDYKRRHAILKGIGRLKDQVRDLARSIENDKE